jgi:hypothetical protein
MNTESKGPILVEEIGKYGLEAPDKTDRRMPGLDARAGGHAKNDSSAGPDEPRCGVAEAATVYRCASHAVAAMCQKATSKLAGPTRSVCLPA